MYNIRIKCIIKRGRGGFYEARSLGTALLIDAFKKILEASKTVAAYAVIVDAKNPSAKRFFEGVGFIPYKGELSLYFPMKTIKKLLT